MSIFLLFCVSFSRAMLCISAAYAVVRCLPIRLSVTFVTYCIKTNNRIVEYFFHRQVATVSHNCNF